MNRRYLLAGNGHFLGPSRQKRVSRPLSIIANPKRTPSAILPRTTSSFDRAAAPFDVSRVYISIAVPFEGHPSGEASISDSENGDSRCYKTLASRVAHVERKVCAILASSRCNREEFGNSKARCKINFPFYGLSDYLRTRTIKAEKDTMSDRKRDLHFHCLRLTLKPSCETRLVSISKMEILREQKEEGGTLR